VGLIYTTSKWRSVFFFKFKSCDTNGEKKSFLKDFKKRAGFSKNKTPAAFTGIYAFQKACQFFF
jgi:hypothetical protein